MTQPPQVSVVVVSRERPAALARCLAGLAQLQYPSFEIIVVADAAGLAAIAPHSDFIKPVAFETPNISAARNLGIEASAGEIVAFIDDDAVPEPTWLRYLVEPFTQADVAAVGGFVRGRNGISFQWKARVLDSDGHATPLSVDETRWSVPDVPQGNAMKTEGTNMAVRRDVLGALGGFDPAYHFFLDETDLNMRLAQAGHKTAIAPLAQVHHGFEASPRRRSDRVPRDLFDIGASWAVFGRKFVEPDQMDTHFLAVTAGERKRLVSHMISGGLEPRDVNKLLGRLMEGYLAGSAREVGAHALDTTQKAPFRAYSCSARDSTFDVTGLRGSVKARAMAKTRVKNGEIVTLLILSPTALFHHVRFHPDGYWEQRGGVFGKADRSDPMIQKSTKPQRMQGEIARIGVLRGLGAQN